jgi:hypothetical protein
MRLLLSPELFSTKAVVEGLSDEWPRLRALILQDWPDGKNVAFMLDSVIFYHGQQDVLSSEAIPEEPLIVQKLPEVVDPQHELVGIATQLDRIILPPNATRKDLEEAISKLDLDQTEMDEVDWDRLHDLVKLRDMYDGRLYRSKKGALGGAPPYFVVEIDYNNDRFAVAESPVEGNATYMLSEKQVGGTWLEALSYSKAEARLLGARRLMHRSGRHLDKIENALIDLMSIAS